MVTGAGKAFSAGGDLAMVQRQIGDYGRVTSMLSEMSDLVYNMVNCPQPIVSAINGVAVGAGLVVALLADISICAEDARLGDGHVRLGVAAGDHAAIIWPLLCGMARARYYLLTGEMVTGAEAERIGLVSKALPREQVLEESLRVAQRPRHRPAARHPADQAGAEQLAPDGRADLRPVRGLRDAHVHGRGRQGGRGRPDREAPAGLPVRPTIAVTAASAESTGHLLVAVQEREDVGLVDAGEAARGQRGQDVRMRPRRRPRPALPARRQPGRAGAGSIPRPGRPRCGGVSVSRPRNQRECSNGTPSVIANPRSRLWSTNAAHQ